MLCGEFVSNGWLFTLEFVIYRSFFSFKPERIVWRGPFSGFGIGSWDIPAGGVSFHEGEEDRFTSH